MVKMPKICAYDLNAETIRACISISRILSVWIPVLVTLKPTTETHLLPFGELKNSDHLGNCLVVDIEGLNINP